ncbi:MAG TPA: lipoyl synthase [Candidatus Bilamarchaeum sp.]|nr:lipoyl synthase [Candidatus Bilamarchaeum sp.]
MDCGTGAGFKISFATGSYRPVLPDWLKIKYADNSDSRHIGGLMEKFGLHSVCQSAHCPNRNECWSQGTATFMVMGEHCTRGCRFCAVKTSLAPPPLDPDEPKKLAEAVSTLNLSYIVITSVARDDLPDEGAGHFAKCIQELKARAPKLIIEVLVPDFKGKAFALQKIVDAGPDVVSHNVETVERLTPLVRDLRAKYRQSLEVLRLYREMSGGRIITKSGMMLGLGENEGEVMQAMRDVREAGAEIFTIGQYLAPSSGPRHLKVKEFVHPDTFRKYERAGYELGFRYMACGPLVRSSYKAGEPFIKKMLESRR